MRKCTKCNEEKPNTEFYKDNSRADKLTITCKECTKAKSSKYYKQNKIHHKSNMRRYYAQNREYLIELMRERYYKIKEMNN